MLSMQLNCLYDFKQIHPKCQTPDMSLEYSSMTPQCHKMVTALTNCREVLKNKVWKLIKDYFNNQAC